MITDASAAGQPANPFLDLDDFVGLPRVGGLWLSPDGRRLVVGVSTLNAKKTRYTTALWEVDPAGNRPARRLTRGGKGESSAAFTAAGDLLFLADRPGADAEDEDKSRRALWLLPADGGEARVVANPKSGIRDVVSARTAGTVVLGSDLHPSATDLAGDDELRTKRKDATVTAILHEEYPVRYWDHDLGPDRTRLFVAEGVPADNGTGIGTGGGQLDLRDLTGHVGRALDEETNWDISPDGRTVAAGWAVAEANGGQRYTVVLIDVATGERTALADDPDLEFLSPRFSPDGSQVAFRVSSRPNPQTPPDQWLAIASATGGPINHLTRDWDRWPADPQWTMDGSAIIASANHNGRAPLWRIDVTTGQPTRLTQDDGSYTDVRLSPDGQWIYALRASVDTQATPVRLAVHGSTKIEFLPSPVAALGQEFEVPGQLTEVSTTAEDGTVVRAWLALPHTASADHPAPLLLWIHGGPLMSWHAWSWRWNPWLAVAKGYAVLLPDPALSDGYGIDFVQRGWASWGGKPYTDLMTLTDATVARPDIDQTRTAAMGGSFGGYMANWVAGHTDRFNAIVTHASLWAMDQMMPTTDGAMYFFQEMTPEQAAANSPHRFADAIVTPMLVIHGDRDYRVPIGEALRLWWDLNARAKAEDGSSPHKFLYFPDENHWILGPNHAKVWYETVFAFLAQHVLGAEWERPAMLG